MNLDACARALRSALDESLGLVICRSHSVHSRSSGDRHVLTVWVVVDSDPRPIVEQWVEFADDSEMDAAAMRIFLNVRQWLAVGRALEKGSPFCLDCGHPITEADRQAPVCPYCGAV